MTEEGNKNWLIELIENYRKIIKRPIDVDNYNIQISSDLRAPLQISLIWLKSEKNDLQIFLINHNEDLSDKTINIFGPYKITNIDIFQDIEAVIEKGQIFENIKDKESGLNLGNVLERLIRNNIGLLKEEPRNKIGSNGSFYKDCFYFIYNGNIFSSSIDDKISYFQHEKDIQHQFYEISKKIPLQYEMIPFLSGYIFPPVWFGDIPKLSMEDKLMGKKLENFVKTIYTGEISGRKIIIKNDGYLGIAINDKIDGQLEEKELYETIGISNFLFSVFTINGIKIKSVQGSEFVYTTFLPEKKILNESYRDYSKSKELQEFRYKTVDLEEFKKNRRIIPLEKLIKIVNQANNLINNEKIVDSLNLLIHSYTNLTNGEINQSFILSWTIIEQYLNYKWDSLLKSKQVSSNRQKKLKGRDYTASVKTEILNLFDCVKDDEYILLNSLRKKRNDFMHELMNIPNEIAQESLNLALKYLKARVNDFLLKKN